jgi:GDPmannose 4,6-dehydratase
VARRALITGITGQDGSYLAELLLDKATTCTHTVRECAELAFDRVGLDAARYVVVDDAFKRPAEVHALVGDASKARRVLGWEPKVGFQALIALMVDADLERLSR